MFLTLRQEHLQYSPFVLKRPLLDREFSKSIITNLLFQCIEIVNDYSDEKVEREERATDDENDEEEVVVQARLVLGLLVHLPHIHCVRHDLHPTLKSGYLKESQVGVADVVERDLGVDPRVVLLGALPPVVHLPHLQPPAVLVNALEELATKELDAHDGEYEPEDETDEQHIDDGRDGVHQCVDHNLRKGKVRIPGWDMT